MGVEFAEAGGLKQSVSPRTKREIDGTDHVCGMRPEAAHSFQEFQRSMHILQGSSRRRVCRTWRLHMTGERLNARRDNDAIGVERGFDETTRLDGIV